MILRNLSTVFTAILQQFLKILKKRDFGDIFGRENDEKSRKKLTVEKDRDVVLIYSGNVVFTQKTAHRNKKSF